jgi:hypothetical protein
VALILAIGFAITMLMLYPRPIDTTDPAIFSTDGSQLNYCDQPNLDGSGKRAADIPKAYTPGCGWDEWPMPVLADCTEPLAPDAFDLRGLWKSTVPGDNHIERIEQCGNRVVVTSTGIIHDFRTDGTVSHGSRDIEPPRCTNTWVAIEWRGNIMSFRPFGLPLVAVTRYLKEKQLMWSYPGRGEVAMDRICTIP